MGCRVYDERQLFWTAIAKGVDQGVGKSGAAKARYENGRSIRNVGESLCCGARSFVHRHRWYASLFLNQQLFLEIFSDLACPFRKFYPGEFACSRITENSRSPVFAEFERAIIQERVRAGLARARSEGKRLDRPRIAPALEERIR